MRGYTPHTSSRQVHWNSDKKFIWESTACRNCWYPPKKHVKQNVQLTKKNLNASSMSTTLQEQKKFLSNPEESLELRN